MINQYNRLSEEVMMNNVFLVGRLTNNPELRSLTNGTKVTHFGLAVDKALSYEKREALKKNGKQTADFPRIVVWGKKGENCAIYLRKGRLVAVNGRLITHSYKTKEGQNRYVTEVHANEVKFLEHSVQQAPEIQNDVLDDLPF